MLMRFFISVFDENMKNVALCIKNLNSNPFRYNSCWFCFVWTRLECSDQVIISELMFGLIPHCVYRKYELMYLLKIKSFGRVNFTNNIVHVINLESIVLLRQLLIMSLNSKVGYLRVKTNNLIHLESKPTSVNKKNKKQQPF